MKDKLYGIGSILVGIMGLYGLYKTFYGGVSWLIDFILVLFGKPILRLVNF